MKRKAVKYVIVCIFNIVLLYLSFMIGRYSWLFGKPSFLFGSKEIFWVQKAKEVMIEDGIAEERLKNPWLQNAIIVRFKAKDANDYGTTEVVLDEMSGELLQWTQY